DQLRQGLVRQGERDRLAAGRGRLVGPDSLDRDTVPPLEPLRVVEVDRVRNVALLRSGTPAQRGESVLFYEVRFQGRNSVSVERIRANKSAPAGREPVPFALTNETLAKLVSDLIEG
ncbi:MAG TPA: hypothetical protein VM597_01175, partial [Gemmataceae bacterium]|nr:hypothetical protein [Gemmataceae bacterium]